jgi:hypothetical protein
MANLSYTDTNRNNQLDEITGDIGASGLLRIYDGSQPADADTAVGAQTLLAECPLSATAAAAASGGVLTFNAITSEASAPATGTATWFRVVTSAGAAVFDGDVSTVAAGTGDLQLDSTSITATQVVNVDSLTVTEGNA